MLCTFFSFSFWMKYHYQILNCLTNELNSLLIICARHQKCKHFKWYCYNLWPLHIYKKLFSVILFKTLITRCDMLWFATWKKGTKCLSKNVEICSHENKDIFRHKWMNFDLFIQVTRTITIINCALNKNNKWEFFFFISVKYFFFVALF